MKLAQICICGLLVLSLGCASSESTSTTVDTTDTTTDFSITSSAIEDGELLSAFQCEEKVENIEASIPLSWSNVPEEAGSLAITMTHYPTEETETPNSYLLLWDIAPDVTSIAHGAADDGDWYMGSNKDGNVVSYTSPCSPSSGTHEYTITIYALSETPSSLPTVSTIDVTYTVLESALETVTTIATASITFDSVTE